MKVVVTGGSGKLGQVLVPLLIKKGHSVLSLDRISLSGSVEGCQSRIVDLKDSGHVFQSLAGADAVVHLAGYPRPNLVPDTETFLNNVATTYNVLIAAYSLGIKKVVIASSMAAFGFTYSVKDWYPDYLPIDEKHISKTQDSYGLSKLVGEKIADSFASKTDNMTISSLRIPSFSAEYSEFPKRWENPAEGRRRLWAYIDLKDAAMACILALQVKFTGHEVFLVSAPNTYHNGSTNELIEKFLPQVKDIRKHRTGNWSCIDYSKAERVLGFEPLHRWEEILKV